MITLALALALSIGASGDSRPETPQCYEYDRDTLSLTGVVIRRVYPGRPNYESVKAGDEPDTVYVLRIPKALCLLASSPYPAQQSVRELQLYFSESDESAIRALRGKATTLRGTLVGADFGWHHLPVLFQVRAARRASARRVV